jgi:hypothetical protein
VIKVKANNVSCYSIEFEDDGGGGGGDDDDDDNNNNNNNNFLFCLPRIRVISTST